MKSIRVKKGKDTGQISVMSTQKLSRQDLKDVFDLNLQRKGFLVQNNIDSFNQLLHERMEVVVSSGRNIIYSVEYYDSENDQTIRVDNMIEVFNLRFQTPTLSNKHGVEDAIMPHDAMHMNATYQGRVWASVRQVQEAYINGETKPFKREIVAETIDEQTGELTRIPIAKIPIMVGSIADTAMQYKSKENMEDPYSVGGYFIYRGIERGIISQETLKKNGVLKSAKKQILQIRSETYKPYYISRTVTLRWAKGEVVVIFNALKKRAKEFAIPLFIFFRALGIETDKDIISAILQRPDDPEMLNLLYATRDNIGLEQPSAKTEMSGFDYDMVLTQPQALKYLAMFISRTIKIADKSDEQKIEKRRIQVLKREILTREFLPHMGTNLKHKGLFLGHMVNELLSMVLGRIPGDDRDSYVFKRIEAPGKMLEYVIRNYWRRQLSDLQTTFKNKTDNDDPYSKADVTKFIKESTAEKMLKDAMSTGVFNMSSGKNGRSTKGVSQPIKRLSIAETVSHLRRIVSNSDGTNNKSVPMRMPHPTSYGRVGISETPEGPNIGIVKSLAISCIISLEKISQVDVVLDLLRNPMSAWHSDKPVKVVVLWEGGKKAMELPFKAEPLFRYLKELFSGTTMPSQTELMLDCGDSELQAQYMIRRITNLQSKAIVPLMGIDSVPADQLYQYVKVMINGKWVGITERPQEMTDFLLMKKREQAIDYQTSIVYRVQLNEIRIYSDAGRLLRPLLRVENNVPVLPVKAMEEIKSGAIEDWDMLQQKYPNAIEYLCAEAEMEAMVASTLDDLEKNTKAMKQKIDENDLANLNRYVFCWKDYTHIEFHPSLLTGMIASTCPFYNHNQSPRVTYFCAQTKQAMGVYASNYPERMDKMGQILVYPQKPLVNTWMGKYLFANELPSGQNVILAVACYSGYNQEDSLIANRTALDRGLFSSVHFRRYHDELQKNPNTSEADQFVKPDKNQVAEMRSAASYAKLNANGVVEEETEVNADDVIIGKITSTVLADQQGRKYKDASTSLRASEAGIVDKVQTGIRNQDGYELMKVRVRKTKKPKIGDKFSSRAGQKGVIGISYRQEDMPFTADGVVPDLIMNPHAFPSRMTVGQLIEMVMGKVCALTGTQGDGTAHEPVDMESLQNSLEKLGYNKTGRETLYCGMTGKKIETMIFMGPSYYQRLRHMVDDKIHARSRGPLQIWTRQPVEGRSRDGGLRLGTMEKDNLISHGMAGMLKERLMECSDVSLYYICDLCGMTATKMKSRDLHYCKACKNYVNITPVQIPYAFKLLQQQLAGLHIAARMRTRNSV
jgi:DNA-directed RNA polymerase beta subunit